MNVRNFDRILEEVRPSTRVTAVTEDGLIRYEIKGVQIKATGELVLLLCDEEEMAA